IRTRVQQLVSECIELRLSSTRQETGRFKALRVSGQTWGLFFEVTLDLTGLDMASASLLDEATAAAEAMAMAKRVSKLKNANRF
ncbi:class I adenylate cyclase, partial [Salmonella enterica subsp. enterica serovar Kentucky]|nr:class I adenylate cyclase [Salmonella enterica subsp. enterica serovar Kentucky]